MKTRFITPMTRVEGTSELVIHRRRNQVVDVSYRMPTARDFQPVLVGQLVEDLPKLVTRICGICPVAHRVAAIKAIETILNISVSPLVHTLRELALLGEMIRSHTYSVFFCTLPDLLDLVQVLPRKDILGIRQAQPRLFSQAFKLYQCAEALIEAVAGSTTMAFTIVPGGALHNISSDQQIELLKQLHATLASIRWAKDQYKKFLNEARGDIQIFQLSSAMFVSCFDTQTNRFYGTDNVALISADGTQVSFPSIQFPKQLPEHYQPDAPTRIVFKSSNGSNTHLITGPHARLAALHTRPEGNNRHQIDEPNLFYTGLLRLDEIEFGITRALNLLENEWQADGELLTQWKSKSGTAGSAVEAPRGTLLYRLSVNGKGRISSIQIRVPTELNANALVSLVENVTNNCLELGLTAEKSVERAKMAIRCFDPCVSCATNTHVRFRD